MIGKINLDCIENVLELIKIIEQKNLQELLNEDENKRIKLWNKLEKAWRIFEDNNYCEADTSLLKDIESRFILAQLKLAFSINENGTHPNITKQFNETELELFKIIEKGQILDDLSYEEIKNQIGYQEGEAYELIKSFFIKMEIQRYQIFENPEIRQKITIAINYLFKDRTNKIQEGVYEYCNTPPCCICNEVVIAERAVCAETESVRERVEEHKHDEYNYWHPVSRVHKKKEPVPVLLGVSAPKTVKAGDIFTARFVAYIKSLEEKVKQELTELSRDRSESYIGVENCRWKLDTHVTVKLSGKHLKVDPSESEFIWKGNRNLVNFLVEVLADAPEEWTVLRYEVFIDGIRVAFIPIDLEITSSLKSNKRNITTIEPANTAFASYASQDRMRVLDRVAAVRISAGLEIFMDCLSIHPGEEWKNILESEIENRDIFLLFWSTNAKKSEWVTWEWKTALVRKGESAIQLHPLQSATEAPPPEELKKFHFGDVYMIVRNAQEKKG